MKYELPQGKTWDDLATLVDEKLCPFSNELLIEFIGVSLKLVTTTELLSKTRRQLKKLIRKYCEEDILDNEELEEATKREKVLNILNLVDVYNPPTPSSGGKDDKPDDDSTLAAINQSMYFKERFKLYNLQIYINIFYFYMIYIWYSW